MDALVLALAPVFIASIALQQVLELADPLLEVWIRRHKKWILGVSSLLIALVLTVGLGFRLLSPLGFVAPTWLDVLVTTLFLTGGTKTFNDVLKWIGYRKESARLALLPEQAARV
jgi:hypothetical protein